MPKLVALIFFLLIPNIASAADFYAAPGGSSSGSGSIASPWNLATALSHPAVVHPGDTIWLLGGQYILTTGLISNLTGSQSAPITVRSYPGDWAVIVGNQTTGNSLQISGAWTVYRDFELMSTLATRPPDSEGLGFYGNHNSLINAVVHDLGNNSPHGKGNLIYGSLFYFNGGNGSGLGHAMYIQNEDVNQPASFEENIIFGSYAFGIHAYAGGVGKLDGLRFIGNVAFINGAAQISGNLKDNYLIGGVNGLQGVLLKENMGWAVGADERSVALGRYCCNGSAINKDIQLIENYFVGTTRFENSFQSIVMTGNIFFGAVTLNGSSIQTAYPSNTYLASAPSMNKIFLRPNVYETGRANIIVYNWTDADTVDVDLSSALPVHTAFEIRNAQNYFASPVIRSIYNGGAVTLPLGGLEPAAPVSAGLVENSEKTGKRFNVFILKPLQSHAAPSEPRGLSVLN